MSRDLEVTSILPSSDSIYQYGNGSDVFMTKLQFVLFSIVLQFLKETQKIPPNVEVCHESLGVM